MGGIAYYFDVAVQTSAPKETRDTLWGSVGDRWQLLIDLALIVVLMFIHTKAQFSSPQTADNAAEAKSAVGSRFGTASAAGITVVGILGPLTLIAIQLSADGKGEKLPNSALVDLFVSNVWLAMSLAWGLLVLYMAAFRGYKENLLNYRPITVIIGYQLIFLFVGMERFVWAIGNIASALIDGK